MKKYIWGILAYLFLISIVPTISSCGEKNIEDVEKNEDKDEEPTIIGTWKYSFNGPNGYSLITIKKDMTAIYSEWDGGRWEKKDMKLLYEYDETNNIIHFYRQESGKKWRECQIIRLTYTSMTVLDFVDSGERIWTRQ